MRRFVYDQSETLVPWVKERIEGVEFASDAVAIGVELDGKIAAAVVYDDFTRNGCAFSVASDGKSRWLSRGFLNLVFAYPFLQCGLKRVGSLVSVTNDKAIRLNTGIGMVREGVIRSAGINGEDLIAFGILREECRFLPKVTTNI